MSSRVFYGICNTAASTKGKVVVIDNEQVTIDNNFAFNEGDLLAVYFTNNNTSDNPSIVIYNNSQGDESSLSNDSGKFIQNLSNEFAPTNLWRAGETVVFCYTYEAVNQGGTETYYWEIVEGGTATTTDYGVTTLFDIEGADAFKDWIESEVRPEEDSISAVTPAMLKRLYLGLTGKNDDEQEPESLNFGLEFIPVSEAGNQDQIGKIILGGEGGSEAMITYPLRDTIQEMVPAEITHTGQLTNNGNGPGTEEVGIEPFITSYTPKGLYFGSTSLDGAARTLYTIENDTPVARLVLDDGTNEHKMLINNQNQKTIINGSSIALANNTTVSGNLGATGKIESTGSFIQANTYIDAPVLKQGGRDIADIYSKKLGTQLVRQNIVIGAEDAVAANIILHITDVPYNNYLGVVGYNLTKVSGDGRITKCIPYAVCYYRSGGGESRPHIRYNIRNNDKSSITLELEVRVLYETYRGNV